MNVVRHLTQVHIQIELWDWGIPIEHEWITWSDLRALRTVLYLVITTNQRLNLNCYMYGTFFQKSLRKWISENKNAPFFKFYRVLFIPDRDITCQVIHACRPICMHSMGISKHVIYLLITLCVMTVCITKCIIKWKYFQIRIILCVIRNHFQISLFTEN